MNTTEKIEQIKQWINQADEKLIETFATQNASLLELFIEALQRFSSSVTPLAIGNNDMKRFQPTEVTLIQKKNIVIEPTNAKQDEPYAYLKPDDLPYITEVTFEKDYGLIWNKETQSLEGTPTNSGTLNLSFQLEDGSVVSSTLFVNPNPQKMWNNIPSVEEQTRFWKADSASGRISTEKGELIAARMRGRSHAHKGTCCDDDFKITYHENTGMYILAVSDGAGSAEYSRYGSQLLVQASIQKMLDLLNNENRSYRDFANLITEDKRTLVMNEFFKQAVQNAFITQEKAAKDANIEFKSLSSTLLLAITLPLSDGSWFTACYWVGDGAAAIFNPALKKVTLLGEVDSGQYSGETQFLTMTEAHAEKLITRIHTDIRDYPPILILMTDGVSDPKFHTDARLKTFETWQNFWQELHEPLQQAEPEKALETWLDFFSKGEHDDRTLAMFIPNSEWNAIQAMANTKDLSSETIEFEEDISQEVQPLEDETTKLLQEDRKLLPENDFPQQEIEEHIAKTNVDKKIELSETVINTEENKAECTINITQLGETSSVLINSEEKPTIEQEEEK